MERHTLGTGWDEDLTDEDGGYAADCLIQVPCLPVPVLI